jgi:hypothetical protein
MRWSVARLFGWKDLPVEGRKKASPFNRMTSFGNFLRTVIGAEEDREMHRGVSAEISTRTTIPVDRGHLEHTA